jgi:hypothetical protein
VSGLKIFGVSMVRNEADIIALNVAHHLSLGLDALLLVDNASSDGTDRILQRLAADKRVRWLSDNSPFLRQPEIVSGLAREGHPCVPRARDCQRGSRRSPA